MGLVQPSCSGIVAARSILAKVRERGIKRASYNSTLAS